MYPNNPMLNQQMALLDQKYAQEKANIMQNFYALNQAQNNWNQQSIQAQQPQTTQPTQNVNWIYVSNIDDAKNHIVQQGCSAWMMDNNEPYFYVKSVDGVGSSTFRIFHIEEVQEVTPEQPEQTQIDMSGYVKREEFDALKSQLDQFVGSNKKVPAKTNKEDVNNG